MLTPDQLDNWFTYHAPTEETAPKYAAIREAEAACHGLLYALLGGHPDAPGLTPADCNKVNAATRAFAEVIDAHAPDSADKTAAIRCVRLARNAANEEIMLRVGGAPGSVVLDDAHRQLRFARWQANGAIACNGK